MRDKTARRELQALGYTPWEPTPEQRRMIVCAKLNGADHEAIARMAHCSVVELEYRCRHELEMGVEEALTVASGTVLELMTQRGDLGVALRAAERLLLSRRPRHWLPPKQIEPEHQIEQIAAMSLDEVEARIAGLERRAAAQPAEAQADDPEGEGEPG